MNKIGVLTCSSKLYPSMSTHIMEGLFTYCIDQNISTDNFILESIGHAGDYKFIWQKVETLLLRPDISIIVAFVDVMCVKQFEPFVNAAGKILITLDMGAHIPGIHIPSPHHIALSLQSAYGTLLGVQRFLKEGKRSFNLCSSMLDAGYTQIYASWHCIEKYGAKVNYNYNVPIISSETNLDYLEAHMKQSPSDAMILQFCALGFDDFQRTYQLKELDVNLPVIVAPFLFERDWLKTREIIFNNCIGYVAWELELDNQANSEMKQAISKNYGKESSIFHVLGWETAVVLKLVINEIANLGMNPIKVVKSISEQTICSPRGELVWSDTLKRFVAPMYEASIVKKEEGYQPELTGVVANEMENWEAFASDIPVQFSNWQNMYLCPT